MCYGSQILNCVIMRLWLRSLGPSRTGGIYARDDGACQLSRDGFEHAPDIFHQNFMSGGVRMNAIG